MPRISFAASTIVTYWLLFHRAAGVYYTCMTMWIQRKWLCSMMLIVGDTYESYPPMSCWRGLELKIALFEAAMPLLRRHCPIDWREGEVLRQVPHLRLWTASAARLFRRQQHHQPVRRQSLHEYIGKKHYLELMEYVDEINVANGGEGTHLYSTGATPSRSCAWRTTCTCWTPCPPPGHGYEPGGAGTCITGWRTGWISTWHAGVVRGAHRRRLPVTDNKKHDGRYCVIISRNSLI